MTDPLPTPGELLVYECGTTKGSRTIRLLSLARVLAISAFPSSPSAAGKKRGWGGGGAGGNEEIELEWLTNKESVFDPCKPFGLYRDAKGDRSVDQQPLRGMKCLLRKVHLDETGKPPLTPPSLPPSLPLLSKIKILLKQEHFLFLICANPILSPSLPPSLPPSLLPLSQVVSATPLNKKHYKIYSKGNLF
jgi:hypothetical protein